MFSQVHNEGLSVYKVHNKMADSDSMNNYYIGYNQQNMHNTNYNIHMF